MVKKMYEITISALSTEEEASTIDDTSPSHIKRSHKRHLRITDDVTIKIVVKVLKTIVYYYVIHTLT